jgi:hypothetical protein
MTDNQKSLTDAYREFGEDLNSSAAVVELRRMRNINADTMFYNSTRVSHPCLENEFTAITPVAYLNRTELYLPAIQLFNDIQKTDFSHIHNVLDVVLTSGIECCIFSEGDHQFKSYLTMKDSFFSGIKSCYDFSIKHYGLLRIQEHEKRKRMLSMHLNFELGVCREGAFVQAKFTVPTRYKPFDIMLYELNQRFYLSVPKESKEVQHPENETFIFEGEQAQADIYKLIHERYRHRVFYSNFKKQFDRYYDDDIQLDGLDLWSTVQLMDAIKM